MPCPSPERPRILRRFLGCESQVSDRDARSRSSGFLAIDNNVAKIETESTAIGRKIWLTIEPPSGSQTAAVLFSFTSTCQRLNVEPWAYLQDVLMHLPMKPAGQLSDLLTDRWQAAHHRKMATLPAAVADNDRHVREDGC